MRYLGASNFRGWRLVQSLWASDRRGLARFESLQPGYNLMDRREYEGDLEAVCREFNLGVITYSSLAQGFLSGKYRRGDTVPSTWRGSEIRKVYVNERGFTVLDELDRVAAERGATVAQVALSWIMYRPGITAPIASATSVEQLQELMGAVELKLTDDERARLDVAST